ncbi:MAG: glycosyltransferase [Pseudobacteriovorax sp.]|nr:glycosyltransferase [Opitutales bacterium]NRA69214.1 glycosyltransferase [Pseudobacteriovorax sp.]
MKPKRSFLIVDPILRGSRLFFTHHAAGAFLPYGKVQVLTRSQGLDCHGEAIFEGSGIEVLNKLLLPDDFWFGLIPERVVEDVANFLENVIEGDSPPSGIYFTGVKEFFPLLYDVVRRRPSLKSQIPMILVDYDFEHWFSRVVNPLPKSFFRRVRRRFGLGKKYSNKRKTCMSLLNSFPNAKFGVLDERVFDGDLGLKKKMSCCLDIPDPGPKELLARVSQPSLGRPRVRKLRLLLVGIQTRRKGLIDVLRVVKHPRFPRESVEFVLYGRLAQDTVNLRAQLLSLSHSIEWHDGYFEEKVIQEQYSNADYVVLPYTADYQGSSGVFAFSMAYGKPVLASSHGCIGYRVGKFGVGLSYKAHDIGSFVNTISCLPDTGSSAYIEMHRFALSYAGKRSVDAHQKTILKFFGLK